MPDLQLDLPGHDPATTKRTPAARPRALDAQIMQPRPGIVHVGFRELGPDNLYRRGDADPEPAAVVHHDVRRGRPPEQRLALAEALVAACTEAPRPRADRIVVEFTRHMAAEMFRDGTWGREWDPNERG